MSSSTNPNQNQHQQHLEESMTNSNIQSNSNNNFSTNNASNIVTNNNGNNIEQPQKKRPKIETTKCSNGDTRAKSAASFTLLSPPDIIDTGDFMNLSASLTSSTHSLTFSSSLNNSPILTPCSSRAASLTQLLNIQNINHINSTKSGLNAYTHSTDDYISSKIKRNSKSLSNYSADEVDRCSLPDLLTLNRQSVGKVIYPLQISSNTISSQHQQYLVEVTASQDMREFEDSLKNQCLCGVSERMLRKPFQSHYSVDSSGRKRLAKLSEWPTNKLLQFLSNLQLLFDIYLKQNYKGLICSRIMDVCDALVSNENNLIDEIIVLADYSNSYVQFFAGRVLASFLVISKQRMNDYWLKKPVDNLFNFNQLDHGAVQKIHFSLEIIKRILEWRDIDLHPLEEEIADNQNIGDGIPSASSSSFHNINGGENETNLSYLHFQAQQPSLESNYFAVHYRSTESLDGPSSSGSSSSHCNYNTLQNVAYHQHLFTPQLNTTQRHHTIVQQQNCHLLAFTDSENFDSTLLKCKTIKILENKWPALVENMTCLIKNHLDVENAENCILNFVQLWEKIISVKANLPIGETQPFYAQLDIELLLTQNISCTIYKQILCLFNEALCYGSTLALQDLLPNETCKLADQIVIYMLDSPILESLPRGQPENVVGLIGFKGRPISYAYNSLQQQFGVITDDGSEHEFSSCDIIKMDKTILQKFVLLVLKSIAVKVKVIRCDSSDSSMDSVEYAAFQDMELIESIIDVLHKLETFIKDTLELLPQCHFSEILIRLFDDQDDHLIEAMVCTLDVAARVSFLNNALPELQSQRFNLVVSILNPVYTFLEFLNSIRYRSDLLLDLLVSNETCFLLYLLRFLKYICKNWLMFVNSCFDFAVVAGIQQQQQQTILDEAMGVLINLRLQISRLVSRQLYPYDISPVSNLLMTCERFYEGLSLLLRLVKVKKSTKENLSTLAN